jgi:hypothetical protein
LYRTGETANREVPSRLIQREFAPIFAGATPKCIAKNGVVSRRKFIVPLGHYKKRFLNNVENAVFAKITEGLCLLAGMGVERPKTGK